MCLEVKPVVQSHLLPKALYAHLGSGNPIRIGDGVIRPMRGPYQAYLLCLQCEDILNKRGEVWVCPRLGWENRSFPLFDLFMKGGAAFQVGEKGEGIYHAEKNPEIDVEKIVHFALGIFWKAGVYSWGGRDKPPMLDLGIYAEEIRLWLRGESLFPKNVSISSVMSRPEHFKVTLGEPYQLPPRFPWREYYLHLLGVFFFLQVGENIRDFERSICFYRNPQHPVLVGDQPHYQYEHNLASHFSESRQTKAYLKERAKRQKKERE